MPSEWSAKAPRLPRSPPRPLEKIEVIVNSMNPTREEPAWMGRSNLLALRRRRSVANRRSTNSRSGSRSRRRTNKTPRKPRKIVQLF